MNAKIPLFKLRGKFWRACLSRDAIDCVLAKACNARLNAGTQTKNLNMSAEVGAWCQDVRVQGFWVQGLENFIG